MRWFKTLCFRLRLCGNVLRGRHTQLYANMLAGNPTAYRVAVEGNLLAYERAVLVECMADADPEFGIFVGEGSVVVGCVVHGVRGAGISG